MKTKQQIKEQINDFEVNGVEYSVVTEYYNQLNNVERYLFIIELEYRGVIYDYDKYPVIPDRYNCIWGELCDTESTTIEQLKKYFEEEELCIR